MVTFAAKIAAIIVAIAVLIGLMIAQIIWLDADQYAADVQMCIDTVDIQSSICKRATTDAQKVECYEDTLAQLRACLDTARAYSSINP